MITEAFPEPPHTVLAALLDLAIARDGTEEDKAQLGDPNDLARPWDPPTCAPTLRRHLWYWLDDVAAWINHDHTWRPEAAIPACWPAHPHLARELAILAGTRAAAAQALTPDPLEVWYRHALPGFLDRMATHLATGCTPGRHTPWPAAARHRDYTTAETTDQRRRAFADDTTDGADHDPRTTRT